MKVLLIKNNRLYSYELPNKIKDNFWITDIDSFDNVRNLINILAVDNKWVLKSNYETKIVAPDRIYDEVPLLEYNFYTIKCENEKDYYYLYTIPNVENSYVAYQINSNGSLLIGKNMNNNIIYNHVLVDDTHAKLDYVDGVWQIYDNKSNFGIYVNDKKIINNYLLSYGDVVFIAGLKIILMKDFLLVNNVNNLIKVNSNLLSLKNDVKPIINDAVEKEEELERNLYAKEEYFYRSPRFIEDVYQEEVVIEDPPAKINLEDNSLLMTVGPMFTMALTSLTTTFTTINNIVNGDTTWKKAVPSLVMAGAMFCSMLVWPMINRMLDKKKRKKKEKDRITKYGAYLDGKEKEIESIIQKQTQTLKDKYISLEECANIITRRRSNLWERSIDQRDFLTLRLGIGNLPIVANIKYSRERFSLEEDEMKKKITKVVDENRLLNDVPITVNLIEKSITSIIGNSNLTTEFFKGLLLQMMTFHSYEFLKIVVLTDKENSSRFDYLRNMPYIFDDSKQIRFYATNLDETKELSLYLEKIYQERKSHEGLDYTKTPPYYLIVTDNYHMYRDVEIINDILTQTKNPGFSLVIFSEKLQNLPSECKNFINVNKDISGIFESEISVGHQKEFKTDFCNNININDCIKKISNIPIEFNDEEKQLPTTVSFLEMYNVGKIEQLNIYNRWRNNNSQKTLGVPVGIEKSGTVLKLDLHEKYHGPHGLIAGMTGSGKSEFIITYILSLAVNFSPEDVAFILIDYKGGGLAGAFENRETGISLPHLAGTITNLDVSEMNRSLASIQSELRRRQHIFNEARDKLGESTVDIYKYQKFYKEGLVEEAVPHLFIISDEFAELKSQQPEFMEQLISAARIGRSLGIHLILATQKPSGVVNDQIWSNSRFRVCLKVQEKSDSNEMIKRPDAALLKQVGRFYLQVGYNELFALGQSAWCGAQYYPTEKLRKKIDQSVVVIDNIGNVISTNDDNKDNEKNSEGEELSNILKHIINVSEENNLKTKKLWLEKILPEIFVDNLAIKYNYQAEKFILNPIIGEYDDPSNQRQDLLTLNLTEEGNSCIYGSSGSGKELLLTTMIYSLITNHTPEEINIYIMDFGAGTLTMFKDAPSVGDVVLPIEEEKINNLFRMIENEIENRKKLFMNYNGDFKNYSRRSGKTVPYILLFINNYDAFQELFDYDERMNRITRDCVKYGIIIITSINTTSGMRYKLRQNFKSDIALQFNDQDDYSVVVGNTRKLYPSAIYGRGLVKLENIYEFQTAYPYKPDEIQDNILNLINELKVKYNVKAPSIPVVPKVVLVDDLIKNIQTMRNVPVGINKDTIKPEVFNFKDNFVTLISASELETTDNFVISLIKLLSNVVNNNVCVFDTNNVLESTYNTNVSYVKENFSDVLKKLTDSIKMQYDIYVRDGYSDKNLKGTRNMVVIINNFSKFLLKVSPDVKTNFLELLEKIKDMQTFDFIFVDQVDSFKKMEYDKWYKTVVDNDYGIWVGNGIADQSLIKTNIGFKKTNNEVPSGYGLVVRNTKTYLTNLVSDREDING